MVEKMLWGARTITEHNERTEPSGQCVQKVLRNWFESLTSMCVREGSQLATAIRSMSALARIAGDQATVCKFDCGLTSANEPTLRLAMLAQAMGPSRRRASLSGLRHARARDAANRTARVSTILDVA